MNSIRVQSIRMAIAMAAVLAGTARAANLRISNVHLRPLSETNAYIHFDISWEHSWRWERINHDAAWVFIKLQAPATEADPYPPWRHVPLAGSGINPARYRKGAGTAIDMIVPDDRMGLFIRRAQEGTGTLAVTNAGVIWDFAAMGLQETNAVNIRVFGVEMVYVAEGPFWVGSGAPIGTGATQETNPFTDGAWQDSGSPTSFPFRITSEDALEIGPEPGKLWATGAIDVAGTLPAEFPKGYRAFYCMKYEVTQAQYVDFLNSLSRAHQQRFVRTTAFEVGKYAMEGGDTMANRNGIRTMAVPDAPAPAIFGCDFNGNMIFNEEGDGQDLAMNFMDAWFNSSIADWMALRWITELEFEKAARGPLQPVPGEFAWGTTNIVKTILTAIVNDGRGNATATAGNCSFGAGGANLVRAGLWAMSDPPTTREQAGASYWGIMELSGNVSERVVSLGFPTGYGRLYTGLHGDGELSSAGWGNVDNWPYINGSYSPGGTGERGGDHTQALNQRNPRISDRTNARHNNVGVWNNYYGFRAVRTAPGGVGP